MALKYRYVGKEQKLSLGAYPNVSLREARDLAKEAKSLLRRGVNPSEQKRLDKYARRAAEANSLTAISQEWLSTHIEDKSASHQRRTRATLDRHLLPLLGNRPLSEITAPELLAVLRRTESAGLIDSAHRARQLFGQIARYAIATGRLERNVSADLKGALKSISIRHYAAITNPADVGRLMVAIEAYRATPVVMAALRISPLLMARPGEIRHMEWAQIDFQNSFGNFSSPDPRSPDFSPYLKSTSYFYSSGGTQLSYAFFASRPDLEARKLLFRSKEDDPTYRSINQTRQQGYMGGESDRKAEDEVYLNGIKIPRSECIGAVIAGECKGTAVFPDKPGRKKCYGSIVGGQCVGAEF